MNDIANMAETIADVLTYEDKKGPLCVNGSVAFELLTLMIPELSHIEAQELLMGMQLHLSPPLMQKIKDMVWVLTPELRPWLEDKDVERPSS